MLSMLLWASEINLLLQLFPEKKKKKITKELKHFHNNGNIRLEEILNDGLIHYCNLRRGIYKPGLKIIGLICSWSILEKKVLQKYFFYVFRKFIVISHVNMLYFKFNLSLSIFSQRAREEWSAFFLWGKKNTLKSYHLSIFPDYVDQMSLICPVALMSNHFNILSTSSTSIKVVVSRNRIVVISGITVLLVMTSQIFPVYICTEDNNIFSLWHIKWCVEPI